MNSSDNSIQPTSPAGIDPMPPETKKTARRGLQNSHQTNAISEAEELIQTARTDVSIATQMAAAGFDAQRLAAGQALQTQAQLAFNRRQAAMGGQELAAAQFQLAQRAARAAFANFKKNARAVFEDAGNRTKLGAHGTVPKDLEKFLTHARAAYNAAQTEPYATELAADGVTAEVLTQALGGLESLRAANDALRIARGLARQTTIERNAACARLAQWMRRFRAVAAVAFRDQPEQALKLKMAA